MHSRFLAIFVLAAVPNVIGADQTTPLRPISAVTREGGGVAQAPAAPQPPAQTPLAPVPVTRMDDAQVDPELDRRVTLTFDGPQDVRDLIEFLIEEETGLSVVMDPGVEGEFRGQLRDRTVREALDLITEQTGLDYTVRDRVVRVFPRELETRLYEIDYVITSRSGTRGLSASSGTSGQGGLAGSTGSAGGGTTGATTSGGSTGATGGGGSSAQVGGNDAPNFWEDLESGVQAILSEEAVLNIDRTAGTMLVTDRTSRLDRVEGYLEFIMSRVTRQVMIEARVIEVELRDSSSAGVNWTAILRKAGSMLTIGQQFGTTGNFTLSGNLDDNFSVLSGFFKDQGTVNVLSSPRVAAMNNIPALIQAGEQDVFFTSTTQRDPQGNIVQATETPQSVTVGVVLSVTPQISNDGIIHMSMNPSVTERTGQATSASGNVVPIVSTRATDTQVRVRQGETIVLGGLMQDRVIETVQKVPLLGDVPFFGQFFKRTGKEIRKTDLVIMLTPTLMGPTDVAEVTAREIRRVDLAQRNAKAKVR